MDAAIDNALERAATSVRNLDWFEVSEIRGWIKDGERQHTQVTLSVGFRLDPSDDPATTGEDV